jgi:hypothetical protein
VNEEQLLQPVLPPGSLSKRVPFCIRRSTYLIPIHKDPATIGLVLLLPVVEQIQAGVVDVSQ